MTMTAAAAALGMSREGCRNSAARCVIASQPAKLHTSNPAAEATASQPCGANGCRFRSCRCGSEAHTAVSRNNEQACHVDLNLARNGHSESVDEGDRQHEREGGEHEGRCAAADRSLYVGARKHGGGRRTHRHGEEKAPAHNRRRIGAEGQLDVGGNASRIRMARPSAENVAARGIERRMSASHATSEAGPAVFAARAGSAITPVPRTAPM